MKAKFFYISFLFLLASAVAVAQKKTTTGKEMDHSGQEGDFSFLRFIRGHYILMDIDVLDNTYFITENYQLKKYDSKGDSIAVFNDVKKFGNPSRIDVSNPLKMLVYYQAFSTAVILDRLLAIRNSINFRKQHIFSVKAIGTSYDNNIWLFDEQDLKLKKIDDDGKLLQESTDLRMLLDTVPDPTSLIDYDGQVYLYDTSRGFYVFDYYGALKNKLPFPGWNNIAIAHGKIYGFSGNKLLSYEMATLNLKTYQLPEFLKGYKAIKAINGKLYLLKDEGVELYELK